MIIIPLPKLANNEIYIHTIFDDTTQQGHRIILLPGDFDKAN